MRDVTTRSGPSGDEDERAAGRARGAEGTKGGRLASGQQLWTRSSHRGVWAPFKFRTPAPPLVARLRGHRRTHFFNLSSALPCTMLKLGPHSTQAVRMVSMREAERQGQEGSCGRRCTKKDAAARRRALAPLLGARFRSLLHFFQFLAIGASLKALSIHLRAPSLSLEQLARFHPWTRPALSLFLLNARCAPDAVPDPHSLSILSAMY